MPAFDPARETDTLELEHLNCSPSLLLPGTATIALAAIFAWTAGTPADITTFWLWTAPVLLGAGLLVATRRRLPLSSLSLCLLTLLGAFLMIGGSHASPDQTLLGAPFGVTLTQSSLFLARAFLIGCAATVLAREILLRKSPLLPGKWLAFLCVSVSLTAFQALEAAGWGANVLLQRPTLAAATVQEYLLVYAGAASSLLCFAHLHDRQIAFLWMDFTKNLDWCMVHRSDVPSRAA